MYKFHINFSVNINMSHKKSISINPSYFKIGSSKKKKKEKPKMKNTLKPNDIKKKLIAKIKAHQKKEKDREITEKEKEENTFKNEFQETLSYLETMKKKKAKAKEKKRQRKERKRNKTMKQTQNPVNIKSDIQIDLNQ